MRGDDEIAAVPTGTARAGRRATTIVVLQRAKRRTGVLKRTLQVPKGIAVRGSRRAGDGPEKDCNARGRRESGGPDRDRESRTQRNSVNHTVRPQRGDRDEELLGVRNRPNSVNHTVRQQRGDRAAELSGVSNRRPPRQGLVPA